MRGEVQVASSFTVCGRVSRGVRFVSTTTTFEYTALWKIFFLYSSRYMYKNKGTALSHLVSGTILVLYWYSSNLRDGSIIVS